MSLNRLPEPKSEARRQGARFATGPLLAGRYELLDRLGEGGMAEVFRARDHRLDRLVAIKVLRPQFGQDDEARTRFAVEARSAAALNAPNIVPVYDFGAADDGSLFIVMRLIEGPSLRRVLWERGALPPSEAVAIGRQVAQALATAHGQGLVHRDVKPGNILLDPRGGAHLTDFGIVKALSSADDLTRSGTIFGTAAYLSPEQATGEPVGPRTDLYALGVVLYETLTGRPPFTGDDPMAVSYRHAHDMPSPLGVVLPGIDPRLEQVVMQCLEKDPRRRPASADELAAVLGSLADEYGTRRPARLGDVAAAVHGADEGTGGADPREPDKETVLMRRAPAGGRTAAWASPAAAAAPVAMLPSARPAHAPARAAAQGAAASPPPPLERGLVPGSRSGRGSRAAARRRGAGIGEVVLLAAIALLLLAAIAALPLLVPGAEDPGVGAGSTPTPQPRTPSSTVIAIEPPVADSTPTPVATRTPQLTPQLTPPPTPTAEITAEPAAEPTPEPTRRSRPRPTDRAPEPTPTPAPQVRTVTARIPDRLFEGDYDGQGSGRYHGRTASWVYGQGTDYDTMTAQFRLEEFGNPGRRATLTLVGLDGENPGKNPIAVALNGVPIYEGPNPLPNDTGPGGPGNWGAATFDVPGEILRRNNTLTIVNLAPNSCTLCPSFVMVDFAELEYRIRE